MGSWLDKAKSLPVGYSARMRHCGLRWGNMVVRNEPTKWSAYCYRCKEYLAEPKTHTRVAPRAMVAKKYHSSDTILPPDTTRDVPDSVMAMVWKYGITKDGVLQEYIIEYSHSTNRLYFRNRHTHAVSSRYCGNSTRYPKWMHSEPYTNVTGGYAGGVIVLTEDFLSAVKVKEASMSVYPKLHAVAVHGTYPKTEVLCSIMSYKPKAVVLAFDADEAGDYATRAFRKVLRPICSNVVQMNIPRGMDPKDMSFDALRHELTLITEKLERER